MVVDHSDNAASASSEPHGEASGQKATRQTTASQEVTSTHSAPAMCTLQVCQSLTSSFFS